VHFGSKPTGKKARCAAFFKKIPRERLMKLLISIAVAGLLGACVTINDQSTITRDAALTAIENARVRECPAERAQANARSSSDSQSVGVNAQDIAITPLASDPTRSLRLRRITVAPGGVIAWHDHLALQGMALVVSGEMTEFRNTCLDPIGYRAGDVVREDAATAHGWRNESGAPAVILAAHVLVR
jgi:quercetin dioxygenase-like cupin family protein